MKHTIRSFSVGLLIAGLIMLVVFYIADDTITDQADLSVEEMIAGVESEGYRVITESEYISYSVGNGKEENEERTDEESAPEEEQDNEEEEIDEEDNDEEEDNESSTEEEAEEETTADENEEEQEEAEEDNTPNTVTINIESGTPSLQISYTLEEQNLVDDAIEFNDYLQQNGYAL